MNHGEKKREQRNSRFVCRFLRAKGNIGFTLVEILVTISIVAILAAVSMPALNAVLARGQTAKCGENIRRLSVAFQMYSADNDGNLPYNYYNPASPTIWWMGELAPYFGFTWDDVFIGRLATKKAVLPDVFRCPADPWLKNSANADITSYGCNHMLTKDIPNGGYPEGTPRTKRVKVVHPSEIILLADSRHGEEGGGAIWRIGPSQPKQAPFARHNGYGNVGWLDGHVTLETSAKLRELHSEAYPWPHWSYPP